MLDTFNKAGTFGYAYALLPLLTCRRSRVGQQKKKKIYYKIIYIYIYLIIPIHIYTHTYIHTYIYIKVAKEFSHHKYLQFKCGRSFQ